jgi:quercetin dioxygenase-like cupin family protein
MVAVAGTGIAVTAGFGIRVRAQAKLPDDPTANPKLVRVAFENERVRVLDITVKPGETAVMHSHPAYVAYVVSGGTFKIRTPDGKVEEMTLTSGTTLYREPLSHSSENVGKTTVHLIDVELKGQR